MVRPGGVGVELMVEADGGTGRDGTGEEGRGGCMKRIPGNSGRNNKCTVEASQLKKCGMEPKP